jgi:ABC-type branched-subunit amino acid transport system substrate-binding protein
LIYLSLQVWEIGEDMGGFPLRKYRAALHGIWLILGGGLLGAAQPALADPLELAVQLPRTGFLARLGAGVINAVGLAVDEANAEPTAPLVAMTVYDDKSSDDGAREAAKQAVASKALAMVGPGVTTASLAAGPILGAAGLASIVPFASGDGVTANASTSTYRIVFSNSAMGGALAAYLPSIAFSKPEDLAPIADRMAADSSPVVMAMIDDDAVAFLKALRRNHFNGVILGTSAIASDAFATYFRQEPEEKAEPGFFTNGIYGVSPVMFDSADADTLAFAERYRARFHSDPGWEDVQGYDAARLAIGALRATAASLPPDADIRARRDAVRAYLSGIDRPERAVASLTGPLWFTPDRGRKQGSRVGRFHGDQFESAPIQFVPVAAATRAEIDSGAALPVGGGAFARRQQVVYAGIYLNEVPRVDIAQSTFTADFYFWLRFAGKAGERAADPTEIDLPDMARGVFDRGKPAAKGDLDDGTVYRMWRIRGDFKNDFDLHRYPLDRQTLAIRLFNATAASDQIVYALDKRAIDVGGVTGANDADPTPINDRVVAPTAFRNLTQWTPLGVEERRDILVTESALGDPRHVAVEPKRELSGYRVDIQLDRRTLATLAKTLLPLGIMTLILFSSLWFPHGLVKEKIMVAITAALSGAVLLSAVNAQLGSVGYTIAVEYLFYIYFALCLLCILSVLVAERLRVASMGVAAVRTERFTQALFFACISGAVVSALMAAAHR